jgi:Protein of unknown function (DUF2961)
MDFSNSFFSLPKHVQTRWASPENPDGRKGAGGQLDKGRKGRPCCPLKSGQQIVLAEESGTSGIVRRIWMTVNERSHRIMRGVRIDIYWDGASHPAVSAPLGDFFGQGLGRSQRFQSIFFSNPEGRSFNCVIPMPFRTGFRIVMTNESPIEIEALFYDVNYTVGDQIESPSYLHAFWNRENLTTLVRDFTVLPKTTGAGRYLGANFSVIVNSKVYLDSWWGEGECKMFIDGDGEHPTLVGTGTEDYIGTAWGQGQYADLYQGSHLNDRQLGQYAFYRYHVPDPVYFQHDIRVVFQQIGGAAPAFFKKMRASGTQLIKAAKDAGEPVDLEIGSLFERQDDWASCCYFYLDRPENGLPALAPAEERMKDLISDSTAAGGA